MKPIWNVIGILPTILAFYVAYRNWPWWREGGDKYFDMIFPMVAGFLTLLLCTLICGGIACGISSVIGNETAKVWHQCWKAKMVSMRNADGVSGSIQGGIFMVSGHVNSEQIYHYYTLKDDGGFQPHKWTADSYTAIYEEDRTDGEVLQYDIKLKNELTWPETIWMLCFTEPDDRLRIEFHIPKGSLKQQFELN